MDVFSETEFAKCHTDVAGNCWWNNENQLFYVQRPTCGINTMDLPGYNIQWYRRGYIGSIGGHVYHTVRVESVRKCRRRWKNWSMHRETPIAYKPVICVYLHLYASSMYVMANDNYTLSLCMTPLR